MIKDQPIHNAIDKNDLIKAGTDVRDRELAIPFFMSKMREEKRAFNGKEPLYVNMIRDALGHHISNYKKALESGNKELVNKHGKKIHQYMTLANKLNDHDSDVFNLEEPEAIDKWMDNIPGFKKNYVGWTNHQQGAMNYDYMASPPHPKHARELHSQKGEKNISGYPLEKIKINGKYVPIHDEHDEGDHPFDSHYLLSGGGSPGQKMVKHATNAIKPEQQQKMIKVIKNNLPRHSTIASNPVHHPDKYGHLSEEGIHENVPNKTPKAE
jgi:hypothetical protein